MLGWITCNLLLGNIYYTFTEIIILHVKFSLESMIILTGYVYVNCNHPPSDICYCVIVILWAQSMNGKWFIVLVVWGIMKQMMFWQWVFWQLVILLWRNHSWKLGSRAMKPITKQLMKKWQSNLIQSWFLLPGLILKILCILKLLNIKEKFSQAVVGSVGVHHSKFILNPHQNWF